MKQINNRYLLKIDELNVLNSTWSTKDKKQAIEEFMDFLVDAYIEGFAGAKYMLEGAEKNINIDKLNDSLNYDYGNESIEDKFKKYLEEKDYASLERLVESEFHRIYNTGADDYANQSGIANVYKVWTPIMDEKTRDTHAYLNGVSAPIDGKFTTFDGDEARFPGDFNNPENNANCRCILKYTKGQ